jgi:dTDP-4-dehydrorhamnose 3,5-epimerase
MPEQMEELRVAPEAAKDEPPFREGIEGVQVVRLKKFADNRGSLTPIMGDAEFWTEPIVWSYYITIRPGRIKGWGMHKLQADRYYVSSGSVRVVLYDGRFESPTFERFQEVHYTDQAPGLLRIPPGVWHADHNWGDDEAHIINFPTRAFNKADPDKYRIDPHSGTIPYEWTLPDG